MDWANERYVRLYTRDTADLLAIGPEGRAVWYELIRKADRAGLVDTAGDLDLMPELLRVRAGDWETGFPRILKRGMAVVTEKAIVLPNYIPAQETPQSDRQRQRESRSKRREFALDETAVTKRDNKASRNVTKRPESVTNGHAVSHDVTPSLAVPSLAVPSLERKRSPSSSLNKHHQLAEELWSLQEALRKKVLPRSRPLLATNERLAKIAERLEAGASAGDCEHVLRVYAAEASRLKPDERCWFDGVSNWRPENFARALGQPLRLNQMEDPLERARREAGGMPPTIVL